jgi:hypothetical protein
VVRDAALVALRAAAARLAAAERARNAAVTAALEAHVTVKAAAAAVDLTETALSQRLSKSRRRQRPSE